MTSEADSAHSEADASSESRGPDFEALYARALAASRARDAAFALISHDLRNPLNAIVTSAEVLRRSQPGSSDALRASDIIGRQVKRLVQLMDLHLNARARPDASPAPPVRQRTRIAVIDSHQDAAATLASILELEGHEVHSEIDAQAGLATLLRESPDVAIIDLSLPGLDGCELALRCRSLGYRGRLIALSVYGAEDDVQHSLAAGFEAHLVKPFDADRLVKLLQTPTTDVAVPR